MKFHWGTGIFIFLGVFILTLGVVLYKSRQVDNALVIEKYYEEDLAYQAKYDKISNYHQLDKKVTMRYSPGDSGIDLIFPRDSGKTHIGKVLLYRANDVKQDREFPIQLQNDSVMTIPVDGLVSGKWIIKTDWTWDKTPLYAEHVIIIQ